MYKNIYLMRHAQAMNNISNEHVNVFDPLLTEKGSLQAIKARENIEKLNIDFVYVSPLNRSLQTADLIFGDSKSVPIVVTDILRERMNNMPCNYFIDDNNEKKKFFSSMFFMNDNVNKDNLLDLENVKSGKKIDNVKSRAFDMLKLLKETEFENIVIITHYGFIRSFLTVIFKQEYNGIFPNAHIKPIKISFSKD